MLAAGPVMQGKDASRNDRLKAALRENLKRRKAQSRSRREVVVHETDRETAPPRPGDRRDGS